MAAIDVVQSLFPDKQVDFVLSTSETDITLIKQLPDGTDGKEIYKIAKQVEEALGVPVTAVDAESGFDLVDAILGLTAELPAYCLPPEAEYYRYNP